jgi:hypothetical protein
MASEARYRFQSALILEKTQARSKSGGEEDAHELNFSFQFSVFSFQF